MTEKKRVAIIGAGVGGLTTAVYLAQKGFNVEVFEKNGTAGGRCGQYTREGHRFDLGATMLLMPKVYHEIFGSLGISLEEEKDIIPLKDLYTIYFDDGTSLPFTRDKERMDAILEKIEPGSSVMADRYVKTGYGIYREGMEKLVGRNFFHLFQMINFSNIGLLFRLKVFNSNWNYAKKYFRHQHLRMAYTFQNIYVGQSPFDAPALFSMVPAAELTEGSFFPKGGMYLIVEKLMEKAAELGIGVYFNSPVSSVIVNRNRSEGVILEDGREIKADMVVANADLPYVYRNLLPDKKESRRLDKMNYSCSAICFHWALDKRYPQLGHHSVFLSDNFKDGLEKIMVQKSVGDNPSFYVHAPSNTDPGAAPPGEESLSVVVAAGHIDGAKFQDWEVLKVRTRKGVIDRLKQFGLTDIEDHIKFEMCHTPESWLTACNITKGSVFGSLGHNIMQMGWFRPHNRHDRYQNLYFAGGSTHPGNGIPNVLMSAKLVAERIILENKQ